MKYALLTKEQLLFLHKEFAVFLASQQIDAKEWETIKKEKPHIAEEELSIFSNLVWEDVLTKTKYLEHISDHYINLFQCNSKEMVRICVQLNNASKSFLNKEDYLAFIKNPLADDLEYFKASKKYTKKRNKEIFDLIQKGSQITKGELFKQIVLLIT